MVQIKDAAVPHYSKYNGKVIFAVRVCPANVSNEPYTVYRRWDEFLDLSAKLSTVFPSASPDPNDPSAIFRRIPRLSRKVTLFPTSTTHSNRRDELDLFVRHLVNLPKAVTSFPAVREFFDVKMNGLDGRQPPSPTPSHTSQFDSSSIKKQGQSSSNGESFAAPFVLSEGRTGNNHHQTLKKKSSKQLLQPAQIHPQASQRQDQLPLAPPRPFRPTLAAKRSTPDLRRFIATSASSNSDEDLPLPPPPPPVPTLYPTLDKFSFPPRKAPECPSTPESTASNAAPPQSLSSLRSPVRRPTSRPSSRDGYVSSIISTSDNASTRTASTVRPGKAGSVSASTSRMHSPMSFVSVTSDESGRSTPMQAFPQPPMTPRKDAPSSKKSSESAAAPSLRHFRSLQDIRNVFSMSPQLPMLDTSVQPTYTCPGPSQPSSAASTPPQTPQSASSASSFSSLMMSSGSASSQGMTRSRSDSKILLATSLPPLAEDEIVSPISSPLTSTPSSSISRKRSGSAAPGMSRSFSADAVTAPGSYPARRPSTSSIRRVQHSLAMTPTSSHHASSSISSIASTSSSSSMSLSRSQASSAGLGLDFSSSSRESFDFSDHTTNSTLSSPDSSLIINSPITPLSASATSEKQDPFDKLLHWQQNEQLQAGIYGNGVVNNGGYAGYNVAPPLPFFPTPAVADQMQLSYHQSRRNSAANRRRASSLHQPVLETILGSPVLGTAAADLSPMITLKVMTESTNYMLKIAKSATLQDVKEKIGLKIKSSGSDLGSALQLAVVSASGAAGDSTAKGSRIIESKTSCAADVAAQQHVQLEDEDDWLLAVSLAATKITLRVIA